MRTAAVLLVAASCLAGCVFGDRRDPGDDHADDADAAPGSLQIVSVELEDTDAGDTSTMLVHVTGPADEVVDFAIAAEGGTFAPAEGATVLDGAGVGLIASQYTAPDAAGNYAHIITVSDRDGHSVDKAFAVLVNPSEAKVGYFDPMPDSLSWTYNYLLAEPITLDRDATLLRIGIIGQPGARAKMAVYRDSGGVPGARVENTASFAMPNGSIELDVGPKPMPAGRYWVAAIFDSTGVVGQNDATPIGMRYSSWSFSSALPATFPSSTSYTYGAINYYVVVDYD